MRSGSHIRRVALALLSCFGFIVAAGCTDSVAGRLEDSGADASTIDGAARDADFEHAVVGALEEGASIVERGSPARRWTRTVVALDGVDTVEASERARWRVAVADGAAAELVEEASLVVFPRVDNTALAAFAVLVFPAPPGGESHSVRATFTGAVSSRSVSLVAEPRDTLGRVTVEPLLLRSADGSGGPTPSAADVLALIAGFAPIFRASCNLDIVVATPADVRAGAFGSFSKRTNFVSVDDDLVGPTGRPPLSWILSDRLPALADAADLVAAGDSVDPRPVRVFVVKIAEGNPSALAIAPLLFHSEFQGIVRGHYVPLSPAVLYDPSAPLFDESVDPPTLLQTLTPYAGLRRLQNIYIGDDHLAAFGHELGHILGLGHPEQSSVLDSSDGGGGERNFMEQGVAECLPVCAPQFYLTPMQCEVMLSGLTGFVETARR